MKTNLVNNFTLLNGLEILLSRKMDMFNLTLFSRDKIKKQRYVTANKHAIDY